MVRGKTHYPLSRRSALVRLGAGSLGMALAARSLTSAAQEATPGLVTDLPPILQEYVAAWAALDADRLAATFAEDAVSENVPTGAVLEGREAIPSYFAGLFAAFEDLTAEITTIFATDVGAAAEWTFGGHYTGQVPGFPPGEGQLVSVRGASILTQADGLIQRAHEYYDVYGILVQLGVVPPPGGATPAA